MVLFGGVQVFSIDETAVGVGCVDLVVYLSRLLGVGLG